jgi:hypothetical protein
VFADQEVRDRLMTEIIFLGWGASILLDNIDTTSLFVQQSLEVIPDVPWLCSGGALASF